MPGPRRPDESELMYAARHLVAPMQRAVNRYQWVVRVLIGLMIAVIAGGYFIYANGQENHATILSDCRHANQFRAQQNQVWQDFIAIIIQPSNGTPQQRAEANAFMKVITGDKQEQAAGGAALLHLLANPSDPAVKAKAVKFLHDVAATDAPRDCARNP